MKKPLIIAIDVDGVLADLDTEWLRRYNVESGDDLTPDKLTGWDIDDQVKPGWKKRLYEILHDPTIYSKVKPYGDALKAVEAIRELGRVVFLTSCPLEHLEPKFWWLQLHGFLPSNRREAIADYLPIRDKHLVSGADILLDDRIKNVEEFPNAAFLVQRPHNMGHTCFRERLPGSGLRFAPAFLKRRFSKAA
jgi:5'-nucleotidase